MQMQTTLDCPATASSTTVNVEPRNSTILSDEHIEYLYAHSFEGMIEEQIKNHLSEEKDELNELKEEYEYLQQFKEFQPKRKPQKYIRVGKQ